MSVVSPLRVRLQRAVARLAIARESWALTDQAVVSGTSFLTNVMLARFLGLHEFGVFALAWMSVLFVNGLQGALIVAPMMSIAPKQEEKDRPLYFGAVVFHETVLALLCLTLVYATLAVAGNSARFSAIRQLALPLAIATFAYQGQDFLRRYFFAARQGRRAFADDVLSYLTQLPILLLLHRSGSLTSATALWAMAGTSLFGLLPGFFWMEKLELNWEWIAAISRRHWNLSRWLGASALLQWTSSNLFIIAAPVYYGAAAAGVLKASQNLMGVTHVWFQGLDNVVPAETAHRLHSGGVASMLGYIRSILFKWGGLTLLFAMVIAAAPGVWLRMMYGPEMVQFSYVLRLYALLYVVVFIGGPLRAGLQALEFTIPVFWSYLTMTIFAVSFAIPMAKWLGLSGSLLGLIASQLIFQGIVGVALLAKAGRIAKQAACAQQPSAMTE